MGPVKTWPTEIEFFAKSCKTKFHHLIGEKQALTKNLESAGEIKDDLPALLSHWIY